MEATSNPTSAEEPRSAPPAAPFWRPLLLYAAAVGTLVALAEVCWSYRLPALDANWRSVLPTTAGGLLVFVLAALATDVPLLLAYGAVIGILAGILRRLFSRSRPRKDRRFAVLWLLLGTAVSYLVVGWLGLFILLSAEFGSPTYLAPMGAAVVASFFLTAILAGLLNLARRRLHRAIPTACYILAVLTLTGAMLSPFSRYCGAQISPPDVAVSSQTPGGNVLLVTLDTLRADYLGCYGNTWVKTPALDALAAESIVFEQAISQAPTTTPSHCSIMTSLYPNTHDSWNGRPMKQSLTTLADVMTANGYQTAAFVSSTTTRSINSGLHQGFEEYVDSLVSWSEVFSRDDFQNLILFYLIGIAQNSEIRGNVVAERFADWLDRREDRPFFVWLHFFDPHDPYAAPPPYGDMYRGRLSQDGLPQPDDREAYGGEITWTDHLMSQVVADLKGRDLYDDTLIIVVSDHGEGFGEKHWRYVEHKHSDHLYDTTQRVPLIVKPRRWNGPGRRIAEQVELIDIAPTVLKLCGVEQPEAFLGKPLDELIEDRPYSFGNRKAYSMTWVEAEDPQDPTGPRLYVQRMSSRTPEWKFLLLAHWDQMELYNLPKDPKEERNVASYNAQFCRSAQGDVNRVLKQDRDIRDDPRARLAPAIRRQLESLGYIGGDKDGKPE